MRVLFISGELIAADLAYRLKKEDCDVRLYIEDESRKDCLDGMVKKTKDWRKELKWVGKDGLIVFDDVGYGEIQDELRAAGYLVVGGSEGGDRLEKDRQHCQDVLEQHGIKAIPSYKFTDIRSAIKFIKNNKAKWVVKQHDHNSTVNYVGSIADGSDVISLLENYGRSGISSITLQKRVVGVEICTARYFNGTEWVGPVELSIEHKHLCNDNIGPMTGEMGNLMWYTRNEDNLLFQNTLARLTPYLQKINYRGDIAINCIVNKDNVYPLEITARFGCPATQMQAELHLSPWKDFLLAMAQGRQYNLKYKKGFGIVISVCIPPFPYKVTSYNQYMKDVEIFFDGQLSNAESERIHFEEVSMKKIKGKSRYFIDGSNGYILYVTGHGNTVKKAREQAYALINKIVIPKMFYRTDIGMKFIEKDEVLLRGWGYV